MATMAFVLISTAPTKEHQVFEELLKIEEILELHTLLGEFDLIARMETEDIYELGRIVVDRIRSIPGVTETRTLTEVKLHP